LKSRKHIKRILWEYAEAIVTALILVLIIRAYVIQAFKIPTGSMAGTLQIGDHLLINKFLYGTTLPFFNKKVLVFSDPERGEIVVFKHPEDSKKDFIKRIIAVGGDTIEGRDKMLFLNGKRLYENFVRHSDKNVIPGSLEPRDNFGPVTVPEGKYFVMGDNRDYSYDSRFWGFVDRDDIKGKALIIYWSWDRKRHLPRVDRMAHLVH
jgi:signal peptidase I